MFWGFLWKRNVNYKRKMHSGSFFTVQSETAIGSMIQSLAASRERMLYHMIAAFLVQFCLKVTLLWVQREEGLISTAHECHSMKTTTTTTPSQQLRNRSSPKNCQLQVKFKDSKICRKTSSRGFVVLGVYNEKKTFVLCWTGFFFQ